MPHRSSASLQDLVPRAKDGLASRDVERLFRTMFEQSPDGVLIAKPDGTVVRANPAACRLLGRGEDEICRLGRGVLAVQDAALQAFVAERERSGVAHGEVRHRRADGSVYTAEQTSAVIPTSTGELYTYVVFRDITERQRAEEALRDSDRRKTEFLAVLSHELRNPIAPIRNSLAVMESAAPDSEQFARARDIARRQAEHLARLVDDLLDLNRISHGRMELRRERIDLAALVRRAGADHEGLLSARGVSLRVDAAPRPIWVDADAARLAQVVGNLLHNAGKFTPRGGAVALRAAIAGGKAALVVTDTGVGMDREQAERLFDPFAHAERTISRREGGLGLGLPLVKRLVELHGGRVSARSDGAGHGAELTVELPLAAAPAAARAPAAGPQPVRPERRRVLLVEDNADGAQALSDLLQLSGHSVTVAHDGRTGIELARALRPDVVVCDLGLPDLTGHDVARALRSDEALRSIRLVALSGYAGPEHRRGALESGFDAHLAKPAPLDDLLRALSG